MLGGVARAALSTARGVQAAGASMLRGGAYNAHSPYDFQGLGIEALKLLREVREEIGLPVVTEVMSTNDIQLISDYADMLQWCAQHAELRPSASTGKLRQADPAQARPFRQR